MELQNVCGRSCTREGGGGEGAEQTHTHGASGLRIDENICVSDLEEGNQYKLLGSWVS